MSKFIFTCPNCKQQLEAEEEWNGMQAECPSCKQTVTLEKEPEAAKIVLKAVDPEDSRPNSETVPANSGKKLVRKVIIRTDASADTDVKIRQTLRDELESKFQKVTERDGVFSFSTISMVGKTDAEITISRRDDSSYEIVASTSKRVNKKAFFSIVGVSALFVIYGVFFSIPAIVVGFFVLTLSLIVEIISHGDYFKKIQSCLDETKRTFRK